MNELTIEELKQLVAFYRQKVSDLEYEVLKNQLIMGRAPISEENSSKNKKSE